MDDTSAKDETAVANTSESLGVRDKSNTWKRAWEAVSNAAVATWQFLGRNIATIISISSMFIAYQALDYSIRSQERDAEYKEIAIQPRPSILPLGEDMSLTVRNVGLGPATVKQIFFVDDGKCVSSHDKSRNQWSELYSAFITKAAKNVYSQSLPPMPWTKGGKRTFDYHVDVLQPNDTIRASEDRYLFKLDGGTLKDFQQADASEQVRAKHAFAEKADAVPIVVVVCSATDRTCMSAGVAEGCAGYFKSE